MKLFLLSIIVYLSSSYLFAQNNSNRPEATCIGEAHWPVKAIYLHGWFTDQGNSLTPSRQAEFANRRVLERYAREHRIRIALPIARQVRSQNGMRTWGGYQLDHMEMDAARACGLNNLPSSDLTLFGYSSGGFGAKNAVRDNPCSRLRRYRRIVAIGTQREFPELMNRCNGVLRNEPQHTFPPRSYEHFVNLLGIEATPTDNFSAPPISPPPISAPVINPPENDDFSETIEL